MGNLETERFGKGCSGTEDGEAVDSLGAGEVCVQVGDGSLASDESLDKEAKHGEHGEATVLDLLHLKMRQNIYISLVIS